MNKRIIYFTIFLLVSFAIQSAAVQVFGDRTNFIPQFLLLLVVIYAVDREFPESLWLAFAAGFCGELFSGFYFGAQIFSAVVIAITTYAITRKITLCEVKLPMAAFLVILLTVLSRLLPFIYQLLAARLSLARSIPFGDLFSPGLLILFVINLLVFFGLNFSVRFLPNEKSF